MYLQLLCLRSDIERFGILTISPKALRAPSKSATRPLVLCVEDNETYLRLRKAVLENAGYSVVSATSASDALEAFREAPVCVVISDHMLRGSSGTALAQKMKQIKPDVPIVLYSGKVPESMKYVDCFINKDESVVTFLKLIADLMKRFCA